MRTKIFFLLMLIIPLYSCSQSRLLSTLPTGNDITKVYIGPAMMKMAEGMVGSYASGYKDVLKEVKSIEVYSCENKAMCKTVSAEFEKLLKSLNTEELVYSEEDGELSRIFIVMGKDNNTPIGMLIYNTEPGEVNIVAIHGKIDAAALNIGK